ncbi:restriction endonuclease subunit S [Paenarthrobacter nicotinovorans]|uniref:restriction endonuclease subunit S n=1 Tax=Paenarthrobacter nicotinovorans TaxID=29320 RepID=UPI00166EE9B0|nr:restriction endonuclease subunit S [Paenarthrobacter nicotinovorans]GGV44746.1 type I restriction modification enzyme protein S [Paenarthrobacter nicotinovorans]
MKLVPLVKVARVVSGGTPKTAVAEYWDGDIPWATPKDLSSLRAVEIHSTPRGLTPAGLNASSAEVLPANSVLFSSRAPIGLLAINSVPMATNQGFKSFVPDPTQLEARYLYRWLEFNRKWLQSLGVGATFKEVSKATVSRIELPLPSLAEQRRIAAILDKADELRGKRRQAIAHLNTLTQSIFHSMFGDTVSNSLNWPVKAFGRVTTSRLGKMLDKKAQTGKHGFKYLRNANVQWFQINTDDLLEMDFSPSDQIEFALRRGDILVCEGGEPGRAAIWKDQAIDCYFQKALHRVRPNPDDLDPQYIVHLLWALAHGGGLKDHVTVATIAHLTGEKLKRMHIPVPPLELQQTFANRIAAVERLKETYRKHLAELDALFASLQNRAFKGEL